MVGNLTVPELTGSQQLTSDDLLDAAFFALSDPTRRAILSRLKDGEASVAELAGPFAMSPRAVAKHVAVLETARLVTRRRIAQRNVARLHPEALAMVHSWIESYRDLWSGRFQQLGSHLDEETAEDRR